MNPPPKQLESGIYRQWPDSVSSDILQSIGEHNIFPSKNPSVDSPPINPDSDMRFQLPDVIEENKVSKSDEKIAAKVLQNKGFQKCSVDHLLGKIKKVKKYSTDNISEAVCIRSVSKKCYEMLRVNKWTIFPLPHLFTLSRRLSHFSCGPGLQNKMFNLLKFKLSTDTNTDTIIMFDEMQLDESTDFNERLKRLFVRKKKVQVVLLR